MLRDGFAAVGAGGGLGRQADAGRHHRGGFELDGDAAFTRAGRLQEGPAGVGAGPDLHVTRPLIDPADGPRVEGERDLDGRGELALGEDLHLDADALRQRGQRLAVEGRAQADLGGLGQGPGGR
ncbi:MAG: hypothetical protein R3F60_11720 [bacterium]